MQPFLGAPVTDGAVRFAERRFYRVSHRPRFPNAGPGQSPSRRPGHRPARAARKPGTAGRWETPGGGKCGEVGKRGKSGERGKPETSKRRREKPLRRAVFRYMSGLPCCRRTGNALARKPPGGGKRRAGRKRLGGKPGTRKRRRGKASAPCRFQIYVRPAPLPPGRSRRARKPAGCARPRSCPPLGMAYPVAAGQEPPCPQARRAAGNGRKTPGGKRRPRLFDHGTASFPAGSRLPDKTGAASSPEKPEITL